MLEQQSIVISYESKPNLVTLKVPGTVNGCWSPQICVFCFDPSEICSLEQSATKHEASASSAQSQKSKQPANRVAPSYFTGSFSPAGMRPPEIMVSWSNVHLPGVKLCHLRELGWSLFCNNILLSCSWKSWFQDVLGLFSLQVRMLPPSLGHLKGKLCSRHVYVQENDEKSMPLRLISLTIKSIALIMTLGHRLAVWRHELWAPQLPEGMTMGQSKGTDGKYLVGGFNPSEKY